MSSRDILVNTLLGVLLVSVFLAPLFLILVIAGYVHHIMAVGVQYYWPGISYDVILFGFLLTSALVSTVSQAGKRRWRNAFLCFAMLPVIASILLADPHSPFGLRAPFWIFGLLPTFVITERSGLPRSQFFLAASAICAVIAINTGLLGSGVLARVAAVCVLVGCSLWFVIDVRQRWNSPKDPGPQAPLSPTHA